GEHAVDFLGRMVMTEADPDGPAGLKKAERLHHRQRVIVAVPDVDAALAEEPRGLERMAIPETDRERGRPLADAVGLTDAVQAGGRDFVEPVQEPRRQVD